MTDEERRAEIGKLRRLRQELEILKDMKSFKDVGVQQTLKKILDDINKSGGSSNGSGSGSGSSLGTNNSSVGGPSNARMISEILTNGL